MTVIPTEQQSRGFATRQLHSAPAPAAAAGAGPRPRVDPIYLTAGFVLDDLDHAAELFQNGDGFSYTRVANPTNHAVEQRIAALEGGADALLVGSGQAATVLALLGLTQAGDHVLSASSIYEGTRGLLLDNLPRLGITADFVPEANDPAAWERAIRPNTRVLFAESIPNPKNDILDIAAVAAVARRHGIPLLIDNTLGTPYLVRPLEHGASIVVHSASKFLAGQGAVLGGVIVDEDQERLRATRELAMRFGPTASPLNAFLIGQGIETLSLRVERQSQNALGVARWLAEQPEVHSVDYSGLESNPFHALAQRYLPRGQGSVFSFTLQGGLEAAGRFVRALEVFTHMTHLGDVRSLILHPGSTSHHLRTDEERSQSGIWPGTLRVSIGIEDLPDLLDDLERGLAAVRESA